MIGRPMAPTGRVFTPSRLVGGVHDKYCGTRKCASTTVGQLGWEKAVGYWDAHECTRGECTRGTCHYCVARGNSYVSVNVATISIVQFDIAEYLFSGGNGAAGSGDGYIKGGCDTNNVEDNDRDEVHGNSWRS